MGTEPLDGCPPPDNSWPPDMDNDGYTDIADVLRFKTVILTCVGNPSYNPRFDFDADACIDIADVMLYKPIILTSCTP